ncbi:MAG: septum formation initiator family protein [Clostridiaceae bacterium]|nr:septum formation initiator family protein [Clostridiaceae bacterium]
MNRRRRKKKLRPMTVFGVIALTAVLCGVMLYQQSALKAQGKEYASQLEELNEEKQELEQEQEDVEEFKEYVKTDSYVEDVAREKFGLVYDGEIIFEPEED